MADLIEVLSLRVEIERAGYSTTDLNFESFYDDLVSNRSNPELRDLVETRVYQYFSRLKLPEMPTIFDYLILSLRENDLIATFNWDPFLLQAYMRNERTAHPRRPRIAFLHGNVTVGVCVDCRVSGVQHRKCGKCGKPLVPSNLLYPVRHKDYNSDPFINNEWECLRTYLDSAYMLTIFGYSAPTTDVEARSLMLEVWKQNKSFELAEVEIVDIKPRAELESSWGDFFHSHHYGMTNHIFNSYLFNHPRRSCDAFFSASLMCDPWWDNQFPRFQTLPELQNWVAPLIAEETRCAQKNEAFSGDPLPPNQKQ